MGGCDGWCVHHILQVLVGSSYNLRINKSELIGSYHVKTKTTKYINTGPLVKGFLL